MTSLVRGTNPAPPEITLFAHFHPELSLLAAVLGEWRRLSGSFLDGHAPGGVIFIRVTRKVEFISHVDVSIAELHLYSTAGHDIKQENVIIPPQLNLATRESVQPLLCNICKLM